MTIIDDIEELWAWISFIEVGFECLPNKKRNPIPDLFRVDMNNYNELSTETNSKLDRLVFKIYCK